MLTRDIDFLGRRASVIALGSVGFGTSISEDESFGILDEYVSLGGNIIDTARVYGDFANGVCGVSESVIGRWLNKTGMRKNIILSTKGAHPLVTSMHAGRLDADSIESDISQSLDALKTDHVDMYYLHRDDISRPVDEIMRTMNALIKSGRTRAICASNWSRERLESARAYCLSHGLVGFSANQPQWSLARMETVEDDTLVQLDADMYEMHARTRLMCMPYSSQAKGFFLKLNAGGESALSDKARRRYMSDTNMRLYENALSVCARTGLSLAEVQLSCLYSQPFPVYPIVGVSSIAQAKALKNTGNAYLDAQSLALLNPYGESQG